LDPLEAFASLAPSSFVDARHGKQAAFVRDQCRLKAALCGRRSGKSNGLGQWFTERAMQTPSRLSVYITRSKGDARRNLLPALDRISRQHGLKCFEREIDGQLIWQYPNGHRLWLAGCDDRSEIGKFRGASEGFTRAAVDEAQLMAFLEELLQEALIPALIDQQGPLAVCGTPHPIPAGYFHSITTGETVGISKWTTHRWTMLDNPFLPHAAEELKLLRERNGWDVTHPTYRREYLGEWCSDPSAMVYRYDAGRNLVAELPDLPSGEKWHRVLSIDFGVRDAFALCQLAWTDHEPTLYVERSQKWLNTFPSRGAEYVRQWARECGGYDRIIGDVGGQGKAFEAEWRARYDLPIEAAEKTNRLGFINLMNGDLERGAVRIVRGPGTQCLIDELLTLIWDDELHTRTRHGAEDHATDAMLYGWRGCYHYASRERKPEVGLDERWRRKAERIQRTQQERDYYEGIGWDNG
jgi:hypothetical protein